MVQTAVGAIVILSTIALALLLPVALVWVLMFVGRGLYFLLANVFSGIGFVLAHIGRFVRSTLVDTLGVVGGILTGLALVPLAVFNVLIGRWSAATHYGGALQDEVMSAGLSGYRLVFGNPIRFLGLGRLTDGIERRLPDVVARAPHSDRPRGGKKTFDGYKVVGSLAPGGSGGKLFLAQPLARKAETLAAAGMPGAGKVVIKAFDLAAGSTLPQIVRESRALEHAKRLGLVLDHELNPNRFWYAMPYVPGDDLGIVTRRLHETTGDKGLAPEQIETATGFGCDLLQTLERFHSIGLWHKDIKPSNIIVSGGRAHLVDLGLVTPLASAMTLTTHGTEYFRDPEMVRLAMRGVKVHEVDGVKFDLYSAGAVLYSTLENSFPAHGSLSRLTKPVPPALEWIIRRAMADLKDRYSTATEMLADLRAVHDARDPFALLPAHLPSVRGEVPPAPTFVPGTQAYGQSAATFASAAPAGPDAPAATFASMGSPAPRGSAPLDGATSAPRRRRRARRVAAALLIVATVWGSSLALFGVTRHHTHRSALAQERHAEAMARIDEARARVESLPQWIHDVDRHVRESRERISGPSPFGNRVVVDHRESTAPVPVQHVSLDHGRIVILDDLPASVDQELVADLRKVLNEERFVVIDERTADEDLEVRLLAGARAAVGMGTPRDEATLERLEDYVREEHELEAILWLASAEDDENVLYHYFAKAGALSGDVPRVELSHVPSACDEE